MPTPTTEPSSGVKYPTNVLAGVVVVKVVLASASSLSRSVAATATVYLVPLVSVPVEVQLVESADICPSTALPVESATLTEVRVPEVTVTLTGSLKPALAASSAGSTVIFATEVFGDGLADAEPDAEAAPVAPPLAPVPPVAPVAPLLPVFPSLQAAISSTGAPSSPARTPRRLQLPPVGRFRWSRAVTSCLPAARPRGLYEWRDAIRSSAVAPAMGCDRMRSLIFMPNMDKPPTLCMRGAHTGQAVVTAVQRRSTRRNVTRRTRPPCTRPSPPPPGRTRSARTPRSPRRARRPGCRRGGRPGR